MSRDCNLKKTTLFLKEIWKVSKQEEKFILGRIIPLGPVLRDESTNGNLADGVDELLESLVKTATKAPATRTTPRERKRTRHADRKSCKCDPSTMHQDSPFYRTISDRGIDLSIDSGFLYDSVFVDTTI